MAAAEVGALTAVALHSLCVVGLAAGHWLAEGLCTASLVTDPSQTLLLLTVCEAPIVIGVFSWLRRDRIGCSFAKSVGHGLVALPIGALINAFGAIVLGAPLGIKYWTGTVYWSLLMSLFTFVPAACVFGASRLDWQHIICYSKPVSAVDYMVSVPAHGAVLGAWFGAFPMPLDWERQWQEWPICVTYGAIFGYLIGLFISLFFAVHHMKFNVKTE
ncbi:hypothetical protein LUZ60_014564 [Juncus effusus]|nr:hypothetical protein LUZ60_014564 [Juncus effusus]